MQHALLPLFAAWPTPGVDDGLNGTDSDEVAVEQCTLGVSPSPAVCPLSASYGDVVGKHVRRDPLDDRAVSTTRRRSVSKQPLHRGPALRQVARRRGNKAMAWPSLSGRPRGSGHRPLTTPALPSYCLLAVPGPVPVPVDGPLPACSSRPGLLTTDAKGIAAAGPRCSALPNIGASPVLAARLASSDPIMAGCD